MTNDNYKQPATDTPETQTAIAQFADGGYSSAQPLISRIRQLEREVVRWQQVAETASAEREHNAMIAEQIRAAIKEAAK